MKKVLLLILMVSLFFPAASQWSRLTSSALSGVDYKDIVYTGSAVVLATDGGIYRSADNGATWELSVAGMDTNRLEVWDMTYQQSRNELWIVSDGVYKSTDHGQTWVKQTFTGLGTNAGVNGISHVGSRLIILLKEWDNDLSTNVLKLAYSDNGTSWSYGATLGLENTSQWRFIYADNNYAVYIIEEPNDNSGDKLWFSVDGTAKVLHPSTGLPTGISFKEEYVSVDPAGNNLFLCDQDNGKYYRYYPGTTSWVEKMNGIGGAGLTVVMTLGVQNLGSHLFCSVVLVNLSMQMEVKLYYSSDLGENWSQVLNPGVLYPVFEDKMVIAGSGRIIGSCFNAHVAYSDNTGQTWTIVNTIFSGEFNSLAPLPSGSIFTHTIDQQQGILKTTDFGNTWTQQNGDLPNFQGIYIVDGLSSTGSVLYATAAEDPFSEKLYIFKSGNEGVNWTKITSGPDTKSKYFAGRHGSYPIFFFSNDGNTGNFQYTTDAGGTWTDISGIASLGLDRVFGIRSNGTKMFLFGQKSGYTKAYLSVNNGANFSDITYDLGGSGIEIVVANRYEWRILPQAIAGFNAANGSFCVAVYDRNSYPWKIDFYKLNPTDDGWIKLGTFGRDLYRDIEAHFIRNISGTWYFGTSAGVYVSVDNCATWHRIWNNSGFQKGIRTGSVLVNENNILLGTFGNGIWKAPLSAPVFSTTNATDILDVSATGGATITSTGGLPFADKGLCWSTNSPPTISDYSVSKGAAWATSFTGTLQPLLPATQYFVKAYINGPKGLLYGNEISFTTATTTGLPADLTPGKALVYPNPAKDVLNINADTEYSMLLLDIIGRTVLSSPVYPGTSSFLIDKLPAGLYFMKLKGESGEVQTIRIVIK